jgi:hypothetical protein
MSYKIHDLSFAKDSFREVLKQSKKHGFKQVFGVSRRTGGSAKRRTLSAYECINTRRVLLCPPLYKAVKTCSEELALWDHVLVHYMLQLLPTNFLDIQDTWVSSSTLGKFVAVSLTTKNYIEIEDVKIEVPKHSAIEFSPSLLHSIKHVTSRQTWMILMVPSKLDVEELIKDLVT